VIEAWTTGTRFISRASVTIALAAVLTLTGCTDSPPPSPYPFANSRRPVTPIPGSYRAASVGVDIASSAARPYTGERAARQFQWPVAQGVVSSGFGIRNGAMHDGVDIAAPAGTPVHAADGGVVIFSGPLHGYGNTVIIRHDDGYATVYAHNEHNLVSEGTRVACGQEIGEIGRSGRTTGANLHFEVRRDNVAQNPLAYLPEPTSSDGISFAAAGGS
jgi:murein DD-endopeptidase MepM/ murein hydrolase activator NlpD